METYNHITVIRTLSPKHKIINIEKWIPVTGFEGVYDVSNQGYVRTRDKIIKCRSGGERKVSGKVLSNYTQGKGYLAVGLSKNNIYKTVSVHRLVAKHFIPNPLNLPQVNHKDGNKKNNHYKNLEWSNCKDNISHALKTGLSGKLSKDVVIEIFNHKGINKEMSDKHNIDKSTVSLIKTGKLWKFLTEKINQP